MIWRLSYSENARKQLRKLDRAQSLLILSWIEKHLEGCGNPYLYGKALVGDKKGYWRYSVGSYRIIADIHDAVVQIEIIHIGHRREVYGR